MKRRRVALVAALALGALVAVVAAPLVPQIWNLKAEYTTAVVIRRAEAFVSENRGRWPRSWADLGEDMSAYTTIDFSLDPEKASASDVAAAIKPVSGRYLTYPHAEQDLKRLYLAMIESKAGKLELSNAADSR
jgi:hypothetical protein